MPIPSPHKGQSKSDWLSSCMGNPVMVKEYDQSQRYAICQRQWTNHKAKAAYVIEAGGDEYAFAKEPDSEIDKRNKTASKPPKDALPGLNPNGGVDPNPDNSNAPSHDLPMRGSPNQEKRDTGQKVDSLDQGKKPSLDDMQWQMGTYTLEPVLDEHTGVAKWPLEFKRLVKDIKLPLTTKPPTKPGDAKPEQPPTAV